MKVGKSKAEGPLNGQATDEIRRLIAALEGVASLEIDLRADGSPRLRVRLDGSVPSGAVSQRVREVLGTAASDGDDPPTGTERKVGLGRGLSDILAAGSVGASPNLFEPALPKADSRPGLALVAVEETVGGISVRAADSTGGIAFSPVEDTRSLNQAVVSAVGRLREERPLPRLSGVEIRDVDGAAVLTVVLTLGDGRKSVGAALVEGGMPFTLGKAVWEALASLD